MYSLLNAKHFGTPLLVSCLGSEHKVALTTLTPKSLLVPDCSWKWVARNICSTYSTHSKICARMLMIMCCKKHLQHIQYSVQDLTYKLSLGVAKNLQTTQRLFRMLKCLGISKMTAKHLHVLSLLFCSLTCLIVPAPPKDLMAQHVPMTLKML